MSAVRVDVIAPCRVLMSVQRVEEDLRVCAPTWQSVSAFCFLRFIVPAILHPHLFGLCPGLPSPPVQRTLTLIAKVMQSLANLNTALQKEEFMQGIKGFMSNSIPAMMDYIIEVSTPLSGGLATTAISSHQYDRLQTLHSLRQRSAALPTLHRESIPLLPHLVDVPKHLAVLISAVVRSSKGSHNRPLHSGDEGKMEAFFNACLEAEAHALQCVSRLAVRAPRSSRRPVTAPSNRSTLDTKSREATVLAPFAKPPSADVGFGPETRTVKNQFPRSRTLSRPSTAPSEPTMFRMPPDSNGLAQTSRSLKHSRPSTAPSLPTDRHRAKKNIGPSETLGTPPRSTHSLGKGTSSDFGVLSGTPMPPAVTQASAVEESIKKRRGFLKGFLGRV